MITPETAMKMLATLKVLFVEGNPPPIHMWLGGNPIAVDRFIESARAAIAQAEKELDQ